MVLKRCFHQVNSRYCFEVTEASVMGTKFVDFHIIILSELYLLQLSLLEVLFFGKYIITILLWSYDANIVVIWYVPTLSAKLRLMFTRNEKCGDLSYLPHHTFHLPDDRLLKWVLKILVPSVLCCRRIWHDPPRWPCLSDYCLQVVQVIATTG